MFVHLLLESVRNPAKLVCTTILSCTFLEKLYFRYALNIAMLYFRKFLQTHYNELPLPESNKQHLIY